MLPKVMLGRTGLAVTRLGYGALELRDVEADGGRLSDEANAQRVLNAVLDAGINFIDTAPSYGRSEEFLGRYLSGRRPEYFLASKCGRAYRSDPPEGSELSRAAIFDSVERSLQRLDTDYLDLLQLHGPSIADTERYDCITTLRDLQAQGKTRFLGMSAVLPNLKTFIDWNVFDTFQIVYSALEPEHEAAIHYAAERGAGTIIRGGAAKGAPVRESGRGKEFPIAKTRWRRAGLETLLRGLDPVETMLRYALGHVAAHTFIVGTRDLEHLKGNIRAVEKGPLEPALQEEIRRRVLAVVDDNKP
jgi:aryl-alcohol dehydrogenase-like predicted oxidoreductase